MNKRLFVFVFIAALLIVLTQMALYSASADGPQPGVAFQATETPEGEDPTVEATEPAADEPTEEVTAEATIEAEQPTAVPTPTPEDGDDDDDDDDGLGTTEIVIIVVVAAVLVAILYSMFGRRRTPPAV